MTEEALRDAIAEVEDLHNKTPCGYHSIDADGLIITTNNTELAWLGYQPGRGDQKTVCQGVSGAGQSRGFAANFPILRNTGSLRALEIEFRRKDDRSLFTLLSATAVTDWSGAFVGRQKQLMIDAVAEPLDVDINDPVIVSASLASGPEVTCLEQHRNGLTPGTNAPRAGCRVAVRWAR